MKLRFTLIFVIFHYFSSTAFAMINQELNDFQNTDSSESSDSKKIKFDSQPTFEELISAIIEGDLTLVETLIKHSPHLLNEMSSIRSTPLHFAAESGHLEVVQFLVKQNDSLLTRANNTGLIPFHYAASKGHLNVVQFLNKTNPFLLTQVNNAGSISLHFAAESGHLEVVQFLIQQNSSLLTQVNNAGLTPLHYAAQNGHLDVAQFLIQQNPSLLLQADKNGFTPLHSAAMKGQLAVTKVLIQNAPSLLTQATNQNCTSLHLAASEGHLDFARYLVSKDRNLLKQTTSKGKTPLHIAAQFNKPHIVAFLAKEDESLLSYADHSRKTPLHAAAENGHVEAIEYLVQQDRNLITKSGPFELNALQYAIVGGKIDAVKALIFAMPEAINISILKSFKFRNIPIAKDTSLENLAIQLNQPQILELLKRAKLILALSLKDKENFEQFLKSDVFDEASLDLLREYFKTNYEARKNARDVFNTFLVPLNQKVKNKFTFEFCHANLDEEEHKSFSLDEPLHRVINVYNEVLNSTLQNLVLFSLDQRFELDSKGNKDAFESEDQKYAIIKSLKEVQLNFDVFDHSASFGAQNPIEYIKTIGSRFYSN